MSKDMRSKSRKVQMMVYLDADQRDKLELLSQITGAPMSSYVRRGLQRELHANRYELDLEDDGGSNDG